VNRYIYRAVQISDSVRCECGAEMTIGTVGDHDCPRLESAARQRAEKAEKTIFAAISSLTKEES
jgi:hypothetical protein